MDLLADRAQEGVVVPEAGVRVPLGGRPEGEVLKRGEPWAAFALGGGPGLLDGVRAAGEHVRTATAGDPSRAVTNGQVDLLTWAAGVRAA